MVSGYPDRTRRDIVKGVMERSEEVEREIREGTRVRFRSMKEIEEMKGKDKNRHRNTWYLKGGATGWYLSQQPWGPSCVRRLERKLRK